MSIQIESSTKVPSLSIEKVEQPPVLTENVPTVKVEKIIEYVGRDIHYDINVIDSLGGFIILLAAVAVVVKVFGGMGFVGSLVRGLATVIGSVILFAYCFSMAIL